MPVQHATDAATPAPPLLGSLPPEAPRRVSTPDALPATLSPAEFKFIESVERYSHTDWTREQRAEPVCVSVPQLLCPRRHHRQKSSSSGTRTPIGRVNNAPNRFVMPPSGIFFSKSLCPPRRFSPSAGASHTPPLSEVRSLADKGRLYTDDDGILLLVQKLKPPVSVSPDGPGGRAARPLDDEPTQIYVPLPMPPLIMQACHAKASCYRSVARTLSMLEHFYWWIGMCICTRWWIRRCLQCQAQKSSRQRVRWPILSLHVPSGHGVAVSVDYFGLLSALPWGNSYIILFTDRLSRRADMYAVSAAESTAQGTADILVNNYIPLWGCPVSLLSDNGLQCCSKLPLTVDKLLGMRKIATSAYHPNGNGGVERVNHTMA